MHRGRLGGRREDRRYGGVVHPDKGEIEKRNEKRRRRRIPIHCCQGGVGDGRRTRENVWSETGYLSLLKGRGTVFTGREGWTFGSVGGEGHPLNL